MADFPEYIHDVPVRYVLLDFLIFSFPFWKPEPGVDVDALKHDPEETKTVARALLPGDIMEGNKLLYENLQFDLISVAVHGCHVR